MIIRSSPTGGNIDDTDKFVLIVKNWIGDHSQITTKLEMAH